VLFNDTIRYNIRYGRWEASDAEVEEAASLAQIDNFIKLAPHGYETEVGERGLKLSGGEKQRVAIARALVCDPLVIFADEPTGNLDSKSGAQVMDILDGLNHRGHTVILVTHETYTAEFADRIIALKDGSIEFDKPVKNPRHSKDQFFK